MVTYPSVYGENVYQFVIKVYIERQLGNIVGGVTR